MTFLIRLSNRPYLNNVLGSLSGIIFAFILFEIEKGTVPFFNIMLKRNNESENRYEKIGNASIATISDSFGEGQTYNKFDLESSEKSLRIMCCVILLTPMPNESIKYINKTWGKRCTKTVFVHPNEINYPFGQNDTAKNDHRKYPWKAIISVVNNILQFNVDSYDWFLITPDDTFVVLENLRTLLHPYSPALPFYLYSGMESISQLAGLFPTAVRCMGYLKIRPLDSRDDEGKERFLPLLSESKQIMKFSTLKFIWEYVYNPKDTGFECCSSTSVSIHYVPYTRMNELEYLIYHLQPYGYNILFSKEMKKIARRTPPIPVKD